MGGKNSFFRKPMGTGKGSAAQMIGMEQPDLPSAELSAADQEREKNFIGNLEQDIAGTSDSLAIAQYKDAQQDKLKDAMALSSSQKGVSNPALLARNVAQAADSQQQDLAKNSAMMRMQERQAALNSMNSYLAAKQGVALDQQKLQAQADQNTMNRQAGFISAAGAAMTGGATAKSDKNSKKNIKKTDGEAREKVGDFLNALDAYSFEYKNEKDGKGEHAGVMAQDLEKTEMGKQMVKDTPEGKVVDFAQGFGALLASMAELNDEVKNLKKKGK